MSNTARNFIRQTTDQVVTNSAAVVNSEILIPVQANSNVSGFIHLFHISSIGGAGIRVQLSPPAGYAYYMTELEAWDVLALTMLNAVIQVAPANFGSNGFAGGQRNSLRIWFNIINGANAGNVALQFAQQTPVAANSITLYKGSYAEFYYT